VQGDLIKAKVTPTNKIGSGPVSAINTEGVNIQTEPHVPLNAPTIIRYDEYSVQLSFEI
jgi:hypothetical protein